MTNNYGTVPWWNLCYMELVSIWIRCTIVKCSFSLETLYSGRNPINFVLCLYKIDFMPVSSQVLEWAVPHSAENYCGRIVLQTMEVIPKKLAGWNSWKVYSLIMAIISFPLCSLAIYHLVERRNCTLEVNI